MTAQQIVLKAILQNYPKVQNSKIEKDRPDILGSTCSRVLRDMKKRGIVDYEFHRTIKKGKKEVPYQHYDFSKTSKKKLQAISHYWRMKIFMSGIPLRVGMWNLIHPTGM